MSVERTYPVERHHFMRQAQRDFDKKIATNRESGLKAFASGEFKPFKGFPKEGFDNLFAMGCELDPQSQQEVITRISAPLAGIAEDLGIGGIFAGTGEKPDLNPHITLFNGKFDGMSPEDRDAIMQFLLSNYSHLNMIAGVYPGLSFDIDTFVAAPVSIATSSRFDESQGAPFRTRLMAEEIFDRAVARREKEVGHPIEGSFGYPYRWNDILHMTIGRITDSASPEALLEFADRADAEIGVPLKQEPIHVTVAGVNLGRAGDIIAKENPSLIV